MSFELLEQNNINILDSSKDVENISIAIIASRDISKTAVLLKENGYDVLISISAVDDTENIVVVYDFYSVQSKQRFVVKCRLDRNIPEIQTVSDLYTTADWHEREAYDLMGIRFLKHKNLKRLLLPDSWIGHPLRKDYKMEDARLVWNER